MFPTQKSLIFAARWRPFIDCLQTKGASYKRHLGIQLISQFCILFEFQNLRDPKQ